MPKSKFKCLKSPSEQTKKSSSEGKIVTIKKENIFLFVCLFLCLIFNFYIFIPSSQTKSQKCGIYFFHISHQKEREVFQGVFIINLILFFILTHCVRVYYYLTSSLPSSESSLSFTSLPSPFSLFLRVYISIELMA